jgi:hypothetical protein
MKAGQRSAPRCCKLMYRRAMAARAFLYLIRNSFFVPQVEQAF